MSNARALTLSKGIPGFPELTQAQLLPIADEDLPDVYADLVDDAGQVPPLLLARPEPFFDGYTASAAAAAPADLAADGTDVEVWLVLTFDGTRFLANLRAPLLIHPGTGHAAQVVLDDRFPLRTPLV